MDNYYFTRDNNLYLNIYIQPRASKNEIVGIHAEELKIRLTAPPVEDKANKDLIKFLAKLLNVPNSKITIQKGQTTRHKLICIANGKSTALEQVMMLGSP